MLSYLFRTPIEEAPSHTLVFLLINIVMMGIMIYFLLHREKISPKIFAYLNIAQQLLLYYWYIVKVPDVLARQGLPIYHCRLAIIVLSISILIGKFHHSFQTFFAYLGLIGSVLALFTLDFDLYHFPHFTIFSYLIGHYLLFYLSLYIMLENKKVLSVKYILVATTIMNCIIQIFNHLIPHSNYGSLMFPPKILPLPVGQPIYFFIANLGIVILLCISRYTHCILDGKVASIKEKKKAFFRTPF